jgi:hypothetical protein
MKMGILRVNSTKKPPHITKVSIRSNLFAEMGVTYGFPVWAIPQHDGFTVSLHENTGNGKLLHVGLDRNKPSLTINFSKKFSPGGLCGGDFLAAKFDCGIIVAKKLPTAQKYYVVGSQSYDAFLQLSGGWLSDSGFIPGAVATISVDDGCISFRAWNDITTTENYSDFVKFARSGKFQIIQPYVRQGIIFMDIPAYILNSAGVRAGDIAGINCEHGTIKLFKTDLQKIGF